MDPFTISAGLVAVLAPLMPALGRLGGAAADRIVGKVAEAVGDGAVRSASALWARIGPALRQGPDAAEAIDTLGEEPDHAQAIRVLTGRVAMLLDAHPELLRAASEIVDDRDRHLASTVTVRGNDNTVQTGGGNIAVSRSSGVTIHGRSAP